MLIQLGKYFGKETEGSKVYKYFCKCISFSKSLVRIPYTDLIDVNARSIEFGHSRGSWQNLFLGNQCQWILKEEFEDFCTKMRIKLLS